MLDKVLMLGKVVKSFDVLDFYHADVFITLMIGCNAFLVVL